MAGVSDLPFRNLCRKLGAGLAVSEMVSSQQGLWHSAKSNQRLTHQGEAEPRSVQIVGNDPEEMAMASSYCIERGAQIIDINMGCPAKKVCQKAAGSALLRDETLVAQILEAVVSASSVPVTLKIRTGWCKDSRNAKRIAHIAQESGICALTIHGRTRACRFLGAAEYDTIAEVVQSSQIPVIANGDINTPNKAQYVLDYTRADAIMVGRAAQGRPWIFAEIAHFLATGCPLAPPTWGEFQAILESHLQEMHHFYGAYLGVRIARKHVSWYFSHLVGGKELSRRFNQLETTAQQLELIGTIFKELDANERLAA